ncbi:MAG: MarR family transcriptional regulator [Planctomycetes bacterium]|nr:MarR family transcriptional regulator [Planctomycetota bacterium]MCB9890909.1 MarR family transcriptional regulator [Planctomycetota bacterium]
MRALELDLEDRIVAAIRRVIRAVDLHSRRIEEACGLTGPQLATLRMIRTLTAATPSAIARAVHLSQPTMTGILRRLEKRGLVSREASPTDRRMVSITLTELGSATLERAPSMLQDRFRHALAGLAEWERLAMLSALQRIASLMDADTLDAAPHLVNEGDVAQTSAPTEADLPRDPRTIHDS